MDTLDIDKVLEVMSSPAVGENSLNIINMLDEVNKVLGKVQHTMGMLESMGLKPLLVRAAGVKLGVDAESPLKSEANLGVRPHSDYHEQVFNQFNQLDVGELGKLMEVLLKPEIVSVLEPELKELEPEPEDPEKSE